MSILIWLVHGSWTTAFVQGPHTHLVPVLPDRGPDGLGRARTWDWPMNDQAEAAALGKAAREAALDRYGAGRFVADWDRVLAEVTGTGAEPGATGTGVTRTGAAGMGSGARPGAGAAPEAGSGAGG